MYLTASTISWVGTTAVEVAGIVVLVRIAGMGVGDALVLVGPASLEFDDVVACAEVVWASTVAAGEGSGRCAQEEIHINVIDDNQAWTRISIIPGYRVPMPDMTSATVRTYVFPNTNDATSIPWS